MPIGIAAQYLTIEWKGPGLARRVEASPDPVAIAEAEDGSLQLEVEIFPEDHAWLGLRLSGALSRAKPVWNSPDGKRQPFVAVEDNEGVRWWVPALAWDEGVKRHLNAFYRSLGTFDVAVGKHRLEVVAVTHGLSRLVLEDYLQDFKNELIWLVLGVDGVGAASRGGPRTDELFAAAIVDFASALSRVEKSPATEIREFTGQARVAKLRPNAATFRQHARTPAASSLPGRLAETSADIPDNRFLRHMAVVCANLCRSFSEAAARHAAAMGTRARLEAERSETYGQITHQQVDASVFDRQLAELEEDLDAVRQWHDEGPISPDERQASFPIRITRVYGNSKDQFFYERLQVGQSDDSVKYRVVELPDSLAALVSRILHYSKDYIFRGTAHSEVRLSSSGKPFRMLTLKRISAVVPQTRAVENKRRKRAQLEHNNWLELLSSRTLAEYQQAARTAKMRSVTFREMADHAERADAALRESLFKLRRIDAGLQDLGIGLSPDMPTGMRFSMQPDYAACLSAYRRVEALARRSGLYEGALEAIGRIGTLHASALYERWCLVKILSVLVSDYGFLPPPGWQEQFITAVTGLPQPFSMTLLRPEIGLGALFEIQPLLANGRRPDFRLRFAYLPLNSARPDAGELAASDLPLFADGSGLIMDAKFRTRWRPGELERALESLIVQKRYDCDGDRVFVLHPVPGAVRAPTSPLEWGAHCDYGHDPGRDHRRGMVWVAPDAGHGDAQRHLRRLIGLALQASFSQPLKVRQRESESVMLNIENAPRVGTSISVTPSSAWDALLDDGPPEEQSIWLSPSFCLCCGSAHVPDGVKAKRTRRNRTFWQLTCRSCEMVTTRTHCYGENCATTLFKNHLGVTYHRTIANQPTNVVCPSCGKYFDEDWGREVERDQY